MEDETTSAVPIICQGCGCTITDHVYCYSNVRGGPFCQACGNEQHAPATPGGVILDPFAGSGSTCCAAVLEGFQYIGIDQDAEYCEIARKRVAHWQGVHMADTPEPTLFDEV